MMAKCSQENGWHQPQYSEFTANWNQYDAAEKDYYTQFKNNRYFPQLIKIYGDTKFVR